MIILEYKDGVKSDKLAPKAKANMKRCANFLVSMIEKYGQEVLAEIEAEEGQKAVEVQKNGQEAD